MKKQTVQSKSLTGHPVFVFLILTSFFALTGFLPQSQSSSGDTGATVFALIALILWGVSIWYWYRHYKVRGKNPAIGVIIAVILAYIPAIAMILDAIWQATFSKVEIGACPKCGKDKLIRENPSQIAHIALPQCPHCKELVGPVAVPTNQLTVRGSPQQIEELKELFDKDLITKAEFEQKRIELLARI